MIYRRFQIDRDERIARYTPPESADFRAIHEPIPDVDSGDEKQEFQDELTRTVQRSCGNNACRGSVSVLFIADESKAMKQFFPDLLWLEHADLRCNADDCPLNEPGAGDREPRNPAPEQPTLSAELPL